MYGFSRQIELIPDALSIYINQLVYDLKRHQRDIITLSLGEAFFEIPKFSFGKLDFQKGYHYSDTREFQSCEKRSLNIILRDITLESILKVRSLFLQAQRSSFICVCRR